MTLTTGSRLGPYEILAPLGAGGMGEVYKARDTRLHRDVAIKVLPERVAKDPEALARFEREARAIAALSHPNILAIHDFGTQAGVAYAVTELLEGETLSERLARGPMPTESLGRIGAEICAALTAAHRKGIVHRDLKPSNVMLAKSGVKLLDFGLAKPSAVRLGEELTSAQTQTPDVTREGSIVGTLSYMSPEQLEGKPVDARSDIFSLGATLYEMATGRKAFEGTSQASVLSAILTSDPPSVSALRPMSPPAFDRLVKTCLAKDPDARWQTAHDVGLQLQALPDSSGQTSAGLPMAGLRRRLGWVPWAVAAAFAALAAAALMRRPAAVPAAESTIRLPVPPPVGAQFLSWAGGSALELSPDGRKLAFVARKSAATTGDHLRIEGVGIQVWVRDLASLEAHPLEGTTGAFSIFWAPDGGSIAFFTGNRLARVSLAGGAPVTICEFDVGLGRSGTWGGTGQILFGGPQGEAIYGVSADGGKPEPLVRPDPKRGVRRVSWPSFLPDGRSFLYLAHGGSSEGGTLMLASAGAAVRAIGPMWSRAQFMDPGYLVFAREGALLAQRFDSAAGRFAGPPLPVAPAVNYFLSPAWAAFTVGRSATLAYQSAEDVARLTWFDRTGRSLGEVGAQGRINDVAIAPDGKRVLFSRARPGIGTLDLFLLDVARGVETPMTSDAGNEFAAAWLPDGKSFVYSVNRAGMPQLVHRQFSSGEERELLPARNFQRATSVSVDGRLLAFDERGARETFEARTMTFEAGAAPAPFRASAPAESVRFSPDGQVSAFLSLEAGRREAYVAPFGSPWERVRVSTGGAQLLRFSRDGKELFYVSPAGAFVEVPIRTSPSVEPGAPRTLFKLASGDLWQDFDVSSDGRFLAVVLESSGGAQPATVVVNWRPDTLR